MVIEKTPPHLRHIENILSWFPAAKIVWIVRDGRACLASLLKVDWAAHDVRTLSRQYRRNIAFGLDAERRHRKSILRIYYEDLVRAPRQTMQLVHAFIGVPFEEAERDEQTPVTVVPTWEAAWKKNVGMPVSGARAEAWREELPTDDQRLVASIMEVPLRRLGHPIDTENGPLRAWSKEVFYRALYSRLALVAMMAGYRARAFLRYANKGLSWVWRAG